MKQEECTDEFRGYLCNEEKAAATIRKYLHDVNEMLVFMQDRGLSKGNLLPYRKHLTGRYKVQTVNVKLSAIHVFLRSIDLEEYRVKFSKVRKRVCTDEERELTEPDYKRLMEAADRNNKKQLYCLMLILYGTGIRIGEPLFVTVEAIKLGRVEIYMKRKYRIIISPEKLVRMLEEHIRVQNIQSECIFRAKSGRDLDRSNICHVMEWLCKDARVRPTKVFLHNFRHLFAKCFYSTEKNLANLADILEHSSIETTRIYIAASISQYEKIMEKIKAGLDDKKPQNSHSVVRQLI